MTSNPRRTVAATFEKVLAAIASVALVAMMLHVVAHGVWRHVFDAPFYGTNEIVAYWYMPVLVLVGLLAAQTRSEHISVTILVDSLAAKARTAMLVVGRVLGFLVSIGFAWYGLGEAVKKYEMGTTAGITTIPMWPITFLVPVVFVVLALLYVATPIPARPQGEGDTSAELKRSGSPSLID
ncbi:TRAP transporter small permease [Dietzia maris]|uniref:TRAP transporter small permease n=1 Tax=Dietzia maris TaxID=37915 RepID=UPI00223BA6FC|nr:TRAP transporter small permease [Dietzia maris]MCT1433498.1 TRAP transporter small permease [Dietzia maris]MCT1520566.1 TRAP transporter small permease [Dietzia maris]